FWNELYGDNHWRRLVTGRHGDRGTFEYFIRELGYGLYPWIALVPAAVSWVAMRAFGKRNGDNATVDKRRDILWFGAIWFVSGYALVSLSMTKFHHYILPAMPGLAIALGCFLDDVLGEKRGRLALLAVLVGLPLLALVAYDLTSAQKSAQRFLWLFTYDYVNAPQGRPWPPDMDYVRVIWVFAGLFAVATTLLVWQRLRAWATLATFAVAVAFTYFLLDVYMRQAAAHWSQKPLIAQYYRERGSYDERLLVWQMYWRGENFYTQNEIYEGPISERTVFLGDKNAENLKDFLAKHSGRRHWFLIERTRLESLKGLLPTAARSTVKIANDDNNKFYLLTANL
ncbi:MAG: hypothetical protein JXP73_14215, partial [Deltaproteobacteria bacterium]|nr:hypothetical protein [Deltaproteobacteria bacterium]